MISLEQLRDGIFAITQRVSRACMKLDPGTRHRLRSLRGDTFAVRVANFEHTLYLSPTEDSIEISSLPPENTRATWKTSGREIFRLLTGQSAPADAVTAENTEGDRSRLITFMEILQQLDIDWEAAIAPYTGDVFAHHIGKRGRATEKWLEETFREARRLAREYVDEELPVARESSGLKPLFDTLDTLQQTGESLRRQIAGLFGPGNNRKR